MSLVTYFINHRLLTIAVLLILVIVLAGLTQIVPNKTPVTNFDVKEALVEFKNDYTAYDYLQIEQFIRDTSEQYGANTGLQLIDEGMLEGLISHDECHELLHYLGHIAYTETPSDYDGMISMIEKNKCLGGYLHGIEAEIVFQSPQVIEDIQQFCAYQKEREINRGACYHGAGHAAIELYNYDIKKSLEFCDALKSEIESDLTNCYRGIFSEIKNAIRGSTGTTGLALERITFSGIDSENPYLFCDTLAPPYQAACKSQFAGILIQELPEEEWLTACQNPTFDLESQMICINIISGLFVRSAFLSENTTSLPATISTFPESVQKVAVLGSAESFSSYLDNNEKNDWKKFCDSFENPGTASYCLEVFRTWLEEGRKLWQERSDIR